MTIEQRLEQVEQQNQRIQRTNKRLTVALLLWPVAWARNHLALVVQCGIRRATQRYGFLTGRSRVPKDAQSIPCRFASGGKLRRRVTAVACAAGTEVEGGLSMVAWPFRIHGRENTEAPWPLAAPLLPLAPLRQGCSHATTECDA